MAYFYCLAWDCNMTSRVPESFLTGSKPGRFKVSPKSERTLDGVVFHSKREAMRYATLKRWQDAGHIEALELQPAFKCFVNGKLLCVYHADFKYRVVETQAEVIEDVKSSGSVKDEASRLRIKAAELQYGFKVEIILK